MMDNPESFAQTAPKVFISYSHESPEHKQTVLGLADLLRNEGVDCNIDQYEEFPTKGWLHWMEKQINKSDFVLVICTEMYCRRFENQEEMVLGQGVAWEGAIISQQIYDDKGENKKFLPVIVEEKHKDFVPIILKRFTIYCLPKDYDQLYGYLTGQKSISPPPLGKKRSLLPRERKQTFASTRKPHNLPRRTYNKFIGRTEEIVCLLHLISPSRQPIAFVTGMGGVGKTTLATEVAFMCLESTEEEYEGQPIPRFDAVIFISFKTHYLHGDEILIRPTQESNLTDMLRIIADVLEESIITQVLEERDSVKKAVNQDSIRRATEAIGKQKTLLIVDNLDTLKEKDSSEILDFLNRLPETAQSVVTTRIEQGMRLNTIPLKCMTEEEASKLIKEISKPRKLKFSESQISQIYRYTDGIPIVICYTFGKLANGYGFSDVFDSQPVERKKLAQYCFESSVEPLRGSSPHDLLISMPLFIISPCLEAIIKVAGFSNRKEADTALIKLKNLALITEEQPGRYSILSITREFAESELNNYARSGFHEQAKQRWIDWYLEFTRENGGQDWENWRNRYDLLEREWDNIEAVLNYCAAKRDFEAVSTLWLNIDNYIDLAGYWYKRRQWWEFLEEESKTAGNIEMRVRSLAEKSWILILTGIQNHTQALSSLQEALDLSEFATPATRLNVLNYLAVLETARGDYLSAHSYLDRAEEILAMYPQMEMEKDKTRCRMKYLFYRAEVNSAQNNKELAKQQFQEVIELGKYIGWPRFTNYARNSLADILIDQPTDKDTLELIEILLKEGMFIAEGSKEKRRIALYHGSYARFKYICMEKAIIEGSPAAKELEAAARSYGNQALEVFRKELMIFEEQQIENLVDKISNISNSS
jgi:SEFIR domain/ATPase domain predominantly from Archaea